MHWQCYSDSSAVYVYMYKSFFSWNLVITNVFSKVPPSYQGVRVWVHKKEGEKSQNCAVNFIKPASLSTPLNTSQSRLHIAYYLKFSRDEII